MITRSFDGEANEIRRQTTHRLTIFSVAILPRCYFLKRLTLPKIPFGQDVLQ